MTTTVKAFRCVLDHCPTPERVYAHEAHLVKHLMGKSHGLKKRQANKVMNAIATTAMVRVDGSLPKIIERPISIEQSVRDKLTSINRLRESVQAEIDDELRRIDSRSRFLARARRMLDV